MKIKLSLAFLFIVLLFFEATAQQGVTTFGVCLRPSFPNSFLRTGPKNFSDSAITYSIVQQSGISFGGLVRHGFTKRLSMETGIIYTKRNYDLTLTDTTFTGGGGFSIIGYEIPVTALVFIQLDEKLWMDAALGAQMNIFPSDVATFKDFYSHYSARRQKVSAGVIANLGVEYRTAKSGYFYVGFVYHRALQTLYDTLIEYYPDRDFTKPFSSIGRTSLEGDYFGIDVKYFFHEDPAKKKKKASK
ncbi:MAG: hypothetical protein IPN36_12300 [Bacteroidetes bacterium]|nr:hypothetical protein [Bacteroidota bacterium]MBL0096818.1 hypothetical protein [Bacteroidota bacterium]